jgi:hypothetical protein
MRVGWRSLFRLILHCLQTRFDQFLHQCCWYGFTYGEANNGFRCSITCKLLPMFLYHWRGYMQAYVRFLEAEPSKHPVVIINSWMGISGPLEIVGAFRGSRRCGPYGGSDFGQIGLRLFWASCYVFIYSTSFAFCQGCVLPLSQCFCIVIRPRTQGSKRKCRVGQFVEERKKKAGPFASQEGEDWARRAVPLQDVGID